MTALRIETAEILGVEFLEALLEQLGVQGWVGLESVVGLDRVTEEPIVGKDRGLEPERDGDGVGRPGIDLEDVIIAVDGKQVATADEFLTAIESKRPGDEVVLSIVREGRQFDVAIT